MIKELNFRGISKSYALYSDSVRNYINKNNSDSSNKGIGDTLVITDTDEKEIGVIFPYIYTYNENGTIERLIVLSFHPDIDRMEYGWMSTSHFIHTEAKEGFVNSSLTYGSIKGDLNDLIYTIQSTLNRSERKNESDAYYDAVGFTDLRFVQEWISSLTSTLQNAMEEEAL